MNYHSNYTNKDYSKTDFLRLIEKRVRKELRIAKDIDFSTTYLLVKDGRKSTKILEKILRNIFGERLDLQLVSQEEHDKKTRGAMGKTTMILSSDCLEEYITKRLEVFFKNEHLDVLFSQEITPLKVVSAEEIKQLAEIFSLQGSDPSEENVFIKELHEQYPQTKTSLVKSFEFISSLTASPHNEQKQKE